MAHGQRRAMSKPRRERRVYRSQARTSPQLADELKRLGMRIRALRNERDMTQEEAASKAGLDAKHFQELESGNVNTTVATLLGVARALKVDVAELFAGV